MGFPVFSQETRSILSPLICIFLLFLRLRRHCKKDKNSLEVHPPGSSSHRFAPVETSCRLPFGPYFLRLRRRGLRPSQCPLRFRSGDLRRASARFCASRCGLAPGCGFAVRAYARCLPLRGLPGGLRPGLHPRGPCPVRCGATAPGVVPVLLSACSRRPAFKARLARLYELVKHSLRPYYPTYGGGRCRQGPWCGPHTPYGVVSQRSIAS
jgi:hypothetical protein